MRILVQTFPCSYCYHWSNIYALHLDWQLHFMESRDKLLFITFRSFTGRHITRTSIQLLVSGCEIQMNYFALSITHPCNKIRISCHCILYWQFGYKNDCIPQRELRMHIFSLRIKRMYVHINLPSIELIIYLLVIYYFI